MLLETHLRLSERRFLNSIQMVIVSHGDCDIISAFTGCSLCFYCRLNQKCLLIQEKNGLRRITFFFFFVTTTGLCGNLFSIKIIISVYHEGIEPEFILKVP